jgi:hypothetical protein
MLDKIDSSRWIGRWNSCHNRLLVLLSLTLVSGCASSIVVKPNIPSPLVEKLPLNINMVYSDTFSNYVYLENEKKRGSLKSIDFTDAQTSMFQQVFSSLTNLVEATAPSKNLSIEPEILDFQYSAPSETKLKQYEIWIKYRLKLRDKNDARVADWVVKGYGKTPTGMLRSASSAFNSATNVALRDVGAQLSIRFPRQRVVKTLLDGGSPPTIAESEPEESVEVASSDIVAEPIDEQVAQAPTFEQTEVDGSSAEAENPPLETADKGLAETEQEGKDDI